MLRHESTEINNLSDMPFQDLTWSGTQEGAAAPDRAASAAWGAFRAWDDPARRGSAGRRTRTAADTVGDKWNRKQHPPQSRQ